MTQPPLTLPPADPRPFTPGRVRLNRWVLSFTRHWLQIVLAFLGVYSGLTFAAPALMAVGLTGPARALYTLYTPFCHQFAFRSIFLFGEQPFYPREIAGSGYTPYETYIEGSAAFDQSVRGVLLANGYRPAAEIAVDPAADPAATPAIEGNEEPGNAPRILEAAEASFDPNQFTPLLQFASRDFVGDARMGYKTAICARDVAIWSAMFLGGLIYAIPAVRRRLRPAPLVLYVFLGLGPIGIDGVSQLLSYPPFSLWPPRETTPFFRLLTGITFGLMNVWIGLPYLEMSARDSRDRIQAKLARAGLLR